MAGQQASNSPRTGRWMRIRLTSRRKDASRKLWRDLPEDKLMPAETSDAASDWKDIECAAQPESSHAHAAVALIDSWLNADEEETKEQKETWEILRRTLREYPV